MSDANLKDVEKPIPVQITDDGGAVATFIKEQQGDQRLGRDAEADDDGADSSGGGSPDGERSRSARRRERARRAREAREGDLEQLKGAFATQQQLIETLFLQNGQQTLSTLESEAEKAKMAYAEAERRKIAAVEAGDGKAVAEADRVMANASTYYNNVAMQHTNLTRKLSERQGQKNDGGQADGRIKLTARGEELRDKFLDDHSWIDPSKNDDVTAAIKTIDARVAADGFDPNTDDYWDEVSERLRKAMPHKFKGGTVRRDADDDDDTRSQRRARREENDDDPPPRRRGGPPLGDNGRDTGRRDEVRLSADMVKALDEAGIPLTGGDATVIKRRNRILDSWRENRPAQR